MHHRPRTRALLAPVGAAVALFAALFAFTTIRLLHVTEGHLIYALDDAYIHMAIAKNVALHGVWGLRADSFAAASSSPLWTALLAVAFKIAGVRDIVPLVLNIGFALLTIVVLGLVLEGQQISGVPLFAVVASAALAAPLVPMVWIGMEHTLHILLTLVTAWGATSLSRQYSTRKLVGVCTLAALMVGARYEGLFVVAGCALVLALSRRLAAAVAVTAAGALPVVAVGAWNVSHGWFFLPSSIMMKQTVLPQTPGGSLLASVMFNIVHTGAPVAFLVLLGAAVALLAFQGRSGVRGIQPLLIIFATAALLHLALARFGWLFRYESYLMVLGTLSVGASALQLRPWATEARRTALAPSDVVIVLALLGVMASRDRTMDSHGLAANVAGHIYRQHRQVAEFLRTYYDGDPVAVNDIGAISYYTRARVYDLMGLGSLEAATLRRAGLWDTAHMNVALSRNNVGIAIVYDTWFQGDQAFHSQWKRIGEWITDREDFPGEGTLSFFARTDDAAARLRAALREFDPHLPDSEVATRVF